MFLLILDKNPYKAAELVPDRLKFKQLLELGQLICSAGISDVYKPINQGKELQEWVKKYQTWIFQYGSSLYTRCNFIYNLKIDTRIKIIDILNSLDINELKKPTTAIFRYVKEYAGMTEYESNAELDIETAVNEYKHYLAWKEEQYKAKRGVK